MTGLGIHGVSSCPSYLDLQTGENTKNAATTTHLVYQRAKPSVQ